MIRQAVLDELPKIQVLVQKAVAVMNKAGNAQWDEKYPLLSHFQEDIEANELYIFLVDKTVAGVACFSEKEHEEYPEIDWSYPDKALTIKRAAVDPGFQGKGIAGELYCYAEKVAAEKGIYYMKTDTFHKNIPARHLFERNGYNCTAKRFNPDKQDDILYFEKKL